MIPWYSPPKKPDKQEPEPVLFDMCYCWKCGCHYGLPKCPEHGEATVEKRRSR